MRRCKMHCRSGRGGSNANFRWWCEAPGQSQSRNQPRTHDLVRVSHIRKLSSPTLLALCQLPPLGRLTECWAHYMHLWDGLETAAAWGLRMDAAVPDDTRWSIFRHARAPLAHVESQLSADQREVLVKQLIDARRALWTAGSQEQTAGLRAAVDAGQAWTCRTWAGLVARRRSRSQS